MTEERFNTSFHQKTSLIEEQYYELLHGNKTEMNIINYYNIIEQHQNHRTNTLPAFIYLFKLEIKLLCSELLLFTRDTIRYSTDSYKT